MIGTFTKTFEPKLVMGIDAGSPARNGTSLQNSGKKRAYVWLLGPSNLLKVGRQYKLMESVHDKLISFEQHQQVGDTIE